MERTCPFKRAVDMNETQPFIKTRTSEQHGSRLARSLTDSVFQPMGEQQSHLGRIQRSELFIEKNPQPSFIRGVAGDVGEENLRFYTDEKLHLSSESRIIVTHLHKHPADTRGGVYCALFLHINRIFSVCRNGLRGQRHFLKKIKGNVASIPPPAYRHYGEGVPSAAAVLTASRVVILSLCDISQWWFLSPPALFL